MRKRTVVGRIYGMKYSWKGHKDRNRHKNRIKRKNINTPHCAEEDHYTPHYTRHYDTLSAISCTAIRHGAICILHCSTLYHSTMQNTVQCDKLLHSPAAQHSTVVYSAMYTLQCITLCPDAGIACWLEPWTRDRKVQNSNPGRSGGRIFVSKVNFVCWLLFSVRSTPVLPQWHVKGPGHSAKSAGGRLHVNKHTPWLNEVGAGWLCRCPSRVWESIRKRAHTQLAREHSITVVSARWATVDWS